MAMLFSRALRNGFRSCELAGSLSTGRIPIIIARASVVIFVVKWKGLHSRKEALELSAQTRQGLAVSGTTLLNPFWIGKPQEAVIECVCFCEI